MQHEVIPAATTVEAATGRETAVGVTDELKFYFLLLVLSIIQVYTLNNKCMSLLFIFKVISQFCDTVQSKSKRN